eukprot:3768242-Lingulodinium_polyedra.AAC.1
MRPAAEVRRERRAGQLPNLYGDPALYGERKEYVEFVKEGLKRGIFRLGRRRKERVKAFFVAKKSGALRLILDCRRSNQHFHAPPPVALFSAGGFGEVE